MQRALITTGMVQGDLITIPPGEAFHHLRRVLRAKPGEAIECLDGQGGVYRGMLAEASDRALVVRVDERLDEPQPRLAITLAQALIRPEHFEWAIQKATELGVARIVPLVTARTVRGASGGAASGRLARWRRIMESAAVQCGRARLPALDEPQTLEQMLVDFGGSRGVFLTPAESGTPIASAAAALAGAPSVTVFIGPEGDFSPEEIALAQRAGLTPVRLGPRVLRAETAAVAAVAILQCLAGEWHA